MAISFCEGEFTRWALTGSDRLKIQKDQHPADDPKRRRRVPLSDRTLSLFGLYVMHSKFIFASRIEQKPEAAKAAWELYRQRMAALDQMVLSDEFLNGIHPTIADCSLAALVGFARDFYNIELPRECPRIGEWYARFSLRPSAGPPEYPVEFLELARRPSELSR